mgnify:CR=1 FL=1
MCGRQKYNTKTNYIHSTIEYSTRVSYLVRLPEQKISFLVNTALPFPRNIFLPLYGFVKPFLHCPSTSANTLTKFPCCTPADSKKNYQNFVSVTNVFCDYLQFATWSFWSKIFSSSSEPSSGLLY